MATISEEQAYEFEETFNLFDTRGDKKIFVRDVGEVLRVVGTNPTEAEVRRACGTMNPDDRINFTQFLPILQSIMKAQETPSVREFADGFRVFDKDLSGLISSGELRHLLTSLGERMTDEEVDALFQGHEDKDGNICYEEFVKAIANS